MPSAKGPPPPPATACTHSLLSTTLRTSSCPDSSVSGEAAELPAEFVHPHQHAPEETLSAARRARMKTRPMPKHTARSGRGPLLGGIFTPISAATPQHLKTDTHCTQAHGVAAIHRHRDGVDDRRAHRDFYPTRMQAYTSRIPSSRIIPASTQAGSICLRQI